MMLLEAINISKSYQIKQNWYSKSSLQLKAVDQLSLQLQKGKILALVGESGCGKSTVAKLLLRLTTKDAGQVLYQGRDLYALPAKELQTLRPKMQLVFQDTLDSLSPRSSAAAILREGVRQHHIVPKREELTYICTMMENCGLDPHLRQRYPGQFSGGQRQRLAIARALSLQPELLILDEPLSALDVSIQAQILCLLHELQQQYGLSYLLISHDLAVIAALADQVAVMYRGRIVEQATTVQIFTSPTHPYTQELFAAIPTLAQEEQLIPSPLLWTEAENTAGLCPFAPRCPQIQPLCRQQQPILRPINPQHSVACCLYQ